MIRKILCLFFAFWSFFHFQNASYAGKCGSKLSGACKPKEVSQVIAVDSLDLKAQDLQSKELNQILNLWKLKASLHQATKKGDLSKVKSLLEQKGDPNSIGPTENDLGDSILLVASAEGHLEVVRHLIKAKANIEDKNVNGDTSLIWASANGHDRVVRFLLLNGAKLDTLNNTNFNALEGAGNWDRKKAAMVLLEFGAEIREGRYPHFHQQRESITWVKELGSSINKRRKQILEECFLPNVNNHNVVSIPKDLVNLIKDYL